MSLAHGMLRGYRLDGRGGGEKLGWEEVDTNTPLEGAVWVHLDGQDPGAVTWLRERSGIPRAYTDLLLAEQGAPQCLRAEDGLLLVVRGVDLNPEAEQEDLVSLRVWAEEARVVSICRQRLSAVADLATALDQGKGPSSTEELIVLLVQFLIARVAPVLNNLLEVTDEFEERALRGDLSGLQGQLADTRLEAVVLKRHLGPQREAVAQLAMDGPLATEHESRLNSLATQFRHLVDILDEVRERTAVIHDFLAGRQSDELNRKMLVLSILTTIFLPLGLLTGLLGINVNGIPGASSPWAFLFVCGLIAVIAALEIWIMKRLGWI